MILNKEEIGKYSKNSFVNTKRFSDMSNRSMDDQHQKYKNIPINASYGLHDFISEKVVKNFKNNGKILDLACGAGALSLRLNDIGFNVIASDIVVDNFRPIDKIPFKEANYNYNFSEQFEEKFDGITAVEIIEHIENPRHFLRQCFLLLEPKGMLILTTPNIDNPVSKAMFVRQGEFHWFTDKNYDEIGHITPISQWVLKKCAIEAGFQLIWFKSHGNILDTINKWWKMKLLAKAIQFISINSKKLDGEILVALMIRLS